MEKQIDEVCRMLRDSFVTGHSDIRVNDLLYEVMYKIAAAEHKDYQHYINCFIQSLRREPEVMNRDLESKAVYHKADDRWRLLNG